MQEIFEKIIDKLEKQADELYKAYCIGFNSDDSAGYDAYVNAIEIVKQEAEKYNNGWIPCSERLPKYGEVVMCSCTNSGITISCITHKGVKPSKSVRFGQHSVIAWQPLPAPYQPHICTSNDCTFNKGKDCPAEEGCAGYERKQTNSDRIRAMSDEELAEFLTNAETLGYNDSSVSGKLEMIEWLQSEVEE